MTVAAARTHVYGPSDARSIVEMDAAALEPHLEALHRASFAWALACCRGRRDEAEDTLQVAYLKVLNGQARFHGRSAIRTWFFAVVRRTAAERRRAGWLRRLAFARWQRRLIESPAAVDPEIAAHQSQAATLVRAALLRLPRRQHEILHLVFYENLSVEEAARVLDVSAGTARTHFARGKERLRNLLGRSIR